VRTRSRVWKVPQGRLKVRPVKLVFFALVTEQSGRTEVLGRVQRQQDKSPGDDKVFVSSPGDFRILGNGVPRTYVLGYFLSVLSDCSVTSAFFRNMFSPCVPLLNRHVGTRICRAIGRLQGLKPG